MQSVVKAFAVLELLDEHRPVLSPRVVGELTGMNRATAYRFCQTLEHLGYLELTPDRRYRPGLRALALGRAALASRELPELAQPHLERLRSQTGETVNMALLDEADIVYVARLRSDQLMNIRLHVGSRLPAHCTSLGRAILAFLPVRERNRLLESRPLQAMTVHTISDRKKLDRQLALVRRQGYAFNDQEVAIGLRGVAAPILSAAGRPVAAVNLSIPRPLSEEEVSGFLGPLVMDAANSISRLLGELPGELP